MVRARHLVVCLIAWSALAVSGFFGLALRAEPPQANHATGADQALLAAFKWRSIGPDRGGRSLTVAGVVGRPKDGYFGATGGGLCVTVGGVPG